MRPFLILSLSFQIQNGSQLDNHWLLNLSLSFSISPSLARVKRKGQGRMSLVNGHVKYNGVGEGDEEGRNRRNDTKRYVYACATFASLNSVLLGYDVGVMSGAILFIQKDLMITEFQEELLIGCLSIIALIGSLTGGRTSDAIGRKWTIALAAIVFQTGAAIMALAPSFEVLMIGRLLAGVGIGFGVMIAPVYIVEISPAMARGTLTSFPEIFINLGILLGYISNYAFSDLSEHINWRIMLGVGIIPSIFIGFALFFIPESPRWLVMQNREKEARAVLLRINETESEAMERLHEIQEAANPAKKHEERAVWREIFNPTPSFRRMLITGCGIQCFQQITGIDATVYYSPTIFRDAGIQSDKQILAATISVGLTKTMFILVAIFLIDRVGRKPLLYVSTIGMTACLALLGIALTHQHVSGLVSPDVGVGLAIFAVCGNVAFFSVGMGPICWVLTSEIFPLRFRAQASAVGAVGNRLSSGLVAMSFLSVSHKITVAGTFFIFSFLSLLSVYFVYRFVPETKGKSLEQIEMLFESEVDWRRGRELQLTDVERLVQKY
ncbi:putative polyol transporter 4 [Carex rostrata]